MIPPSLLLDPIDAVLGGLTPLLGAGVVTLDALGEIINGFVKP